MLIHAVVKSVLLSAFILFSKVLFLPGLMKYVRRNKLTSIILPITGNVRILIQK